MPLYPRRTSLYWCVFWTAAASRMSKHSIDLQGETLSTAACQGVHVQEAGGEERKHKGPKTIVDALRAGLGRRIILTYIQGI